MSNRAKLTKHASRETIHFIAHRSNFPLVFFSHLSSLLINENRLLSRSEIAEKQSELIARNKLMNCIQECDNEEMKIECESWLKIRLKKSTAVKNPNNFSVFLDSMPNESEKKQGDIRW